jgi:outer membrane protein assembly factor BamB
MSRRFASLAYTGNDASYGPVISGDGFTVAFMSRANNLIPEDPDASNQEDVFALKAPDRTAFFTSRTSAATTVELEWITPPADYLATRLFEKIGSCPVSLNDAIATATDLGLVTVPANAKGYLSLPGRIPGTSYCYALFYQRDDLGYGPGINAPIRTVRARPFAASDSANIKWASGFGISALTQVGIGTNSLIAVANDGGVYAMSRGATGGLSPAAYWPFAVGAIQGRPPVVGLGIDGSTRTTYVGSQDGRAYAFDADRGAAAGGALWYTPPLGTNVLAGAAGMFTMFGGAGNHVLIGSRNGSNGRFSSLNAVDGTVRDSFTLSLPPLRPVLGTAAVDYANNRVYFTSLASGLLEPSLWCRFITPTGFGLLDCWALPVTAPGGISGGPVQRGNRLYVGDDGGQVWAFDATLGLQAWSFSSCGAPNPVKGFVFPDRGGAAQDLYFASDSALCAIRDNGPSATLKWSKSYAQINNSSTPILARVSGVPYIYVGSSDGRLYQIHADTAATTSVLLGGGGTTIGAPAFDVFDNMIYVGSDAGVIYAVQAPIP